MSVEDDAQGMINLSREYIQAVVNTNNGATANVGDSIGSLEEIRLETSTSIGQASSLMGEGHPATKGVVLSGIAVNKKSEEISDLLNKARDMMIELDQLASVHSETIALIGRQLLGGGNQQ